MPDIQLLDGKKITFDKAINGFDLVKKISKSLEKKALIMKVDGDLKISGTLTIQEQGTVSGSVEYQNLHIKLGGKISGDIKMSEKIKKISDAPKNTSSSLQDSIKEQKK